LHWGVIRFIHIGFLFPGFIAHLVGTFEIICGLHVTFGLFTLIAIMPLLIINIVAIDPIKIPEL
jgi:uncharacterized membrane protein YphA (DoxX/SURF4 family)